MWALGLVIWEMCTLEHPLETTDGYGEGMVEAKLVVAKQANLSKSIDGQSLLGKCIKALLSFNPSERPKPGVVIAEAYRYLLRESC